MSIAGRSESLFHLRELNASVRTEVNAGLTTFLTMAYIIIVNPAILTAAGIPFGPAMVATIASAIFGTLLMGVFANRPFAIAPYMGQNAFVAYTVCGTLGYSWQTAFFATFISGLMMLALTLTGGRRALTEAVPDSLKASFAIGIGLFIAFVGAVNSGIVVLGTATAPVALGDVMSDAVLLAIFGLVLTSVLIVRKVRGGVLLGILGTSLLGFVTGIVAMPDAILSVPPDISPILVQWDIALEWSLVSVILTLFVLDVVDTMGTLIGLSDKTGLLDEDGNLPEIEKPFIVDSLATVFSGIVGTTSSGVYIESATGIEEGGKTGLTAVIIASLFAVALFLSPIFEAIPMAATGPVLIIVGVMMFESVWKLRTDDATELIPAVLTIILMNFTYNIGIGICAGFVIYPLLKIATGRWREVKGMMWAFFVISVLFFIFFPS